MARNDNDVFYGVDRTTVLIYVLLVIMGWLNIYAAVFNEEHQNIFDTTQKYGKQLIWISGAAIIAFSILLIDANFYTAFSYFFYGFFLLANILVIWLGREVKQRADRVVKLSYLVLLPSLYDPCRAYE